jgi:spore coat protein CotH
VFWISASVEAQSGQQKVTQEKQVENEAQDGAANDAQKLTAEGLYADDRVTEIKIEIEEADWDKIRFQSRSFGEALKKELAEKIFTYVKGDVTIDGVLIKNVGIRKKGFLGSLNTERPSLKIKFSEYENQSPVSGLDRLTLNNNNQEKGRIGQFMAFRLFRESGTHAPRCGFASVTVNGKHLGIYSNVESIKPDFLRHSFGNSSGELYEGTVTDFFPGYVDKFEMKNKSANTEHIQAVIDALDVEEIDDENLARLGELIDLDSFTKYWALESTIGFWDSYCSNQNNYYLYRDGDTKKFHFIPWGADSAFTETMPLPPYRIRPRAVHGKAILPNKLYRNEKIQAKYKETLLAFLDQHWNEEELIAEVDRLETMLKDYVKEDNRGFSRAVNSYRRFIKARRKKLMGEFDDGYPKLDKPPRKPVYFKEIGSVEATFKTKWCKSDPGKAADGEELTFTLKVDDELIELKDAYVYAKKDDFQKENASVLISGKNKSGKQFVIAASLSKSDFLNVSPKPKSCGGALVKGGMLGMLNPDFKMMAGTIQIDESSTEPGGTVSGKFTMTVGEFNMGE